jgi:hypothetical protein
MIPWILTPAPGTPLYDACKQEGRLIHENYSQYDGLHAVFIPKRITPDELTDAYWRAARRFYGLLAIGPRVMRAKRGRIAELLYNLHVRRQVRRGLHPFSGQPA